MISKQARRLWGPVVAAFGLAGSAMAAPDSWDARLDQICDLRVIDVAASVPAGQGYWRLVSGVFENEQQSGGTHHIYYKALDVNGSPIENQRTFGSWPYNNTAINPSQCVGSNWACQNTKGAIDQYWGNFPMWAQCGPGGCQWPFNAWIDETTSPRGYVGLSDKVVGMGMTSPQGTGCGAHVNFRLTWRWTIKAVPNPAISRSPVSLLHTITVGEPLANDSFAVWNSGAGTLNYGISDNAGWLSVNPTTGTSTGSANNHQVIYSLAGPALGTHNATITISDTAGVAASATIGVAITVKPLIIPGDMDGDLDVDQADFGMLQLCLTSNGIVASPACETARLDEDNDVDAADVALFLGCMTAPNVTGDPGCTGS